MSRIVVILPTETYRAADFVEAASRLGIELSIASERALPLVPPDRQVEIDCSDPEASAERVADLGSATPVDAIVAADDAGVEIAARASTLLGLPTSPIMAARATLDKAEMRLRLAAAEVPQPRFEVVSTPSEGAAAATRLGFPVVTKPRTRSASVGVMRSDDLDQLSDAVAVAQLHQRADDGTGRILVESFAPGGEISVEGLVWDGELEVLAIFDKPDQPDGPTFAETLFVTPTALDESTVAEVERVVGLAISGLGLTTGPVHAELRVDAGRPVVIEIAARTIGGICGRSLSFGLMGDTLESLVLRQALGSRKEGLRRFGQASGVMMIPVPEPGILDRVEGLTAAESIPGVTGIEITISTGSEVSPAPEGDRYLGFIFARAATREAVIDALHAAHDELTVVVTGRI